MTECEHETAATPSSKMATSAPPAPTLTGPGVRHGSDRTASVSVSTMGSSSSLLLSIAAHRYLQWLAELQHSIEAISDDAYTLDRLLRQGVLPLRQRTSAAPTAVEARLRTAMCQLLLGVEALRGGPHAPSSQAPPPHPHSIWASPAPSVGSSNGGATATHSVMTHAEAPSCPCRAYLEQLQREAESRQFAEHDDSSSRSRSRSRSSSVADAADEGKGDGSDASSGEDGDDAAQPRLSATVSHFTSRLKDALRKSSRSRNGGGGDDEGAGEELAEKLLARTVALDRHMRHRRGSRHHRADPHVRRGQRLSDAKAVPSPPSTPVPLLPITVAAGPPTPADAKEDVVVLPPSATSRLAVPVDGASHGDRALHPMLAHISPDELRRCPVCSAQLLLQGAWHALYQLELLALLSAAPAMAAPLPLPPPSVLRLHPTEGLLLLLHAAHRCFVVGTTMAMTVSVPAKSETSTEVPQPVLSALDVLRGVTVGSAAAAAAAAVGDASGASAQERVVSVLAGALLAVADSVTGTAAPLLWPREARAAPASPPRGVTAVAGDVLALRVRLYHTAFVVLMTADGAAAALSALADDGEALARCVRCLMRLPPHAGAKRGSVTADVVEGEAGGAAKERVDGAAGHDSLAPPPPPPPPTSAVTTAAEQVSQRLRTAFALLDTSPSPASSSDDATATLQDDVRALCCVAAMLGTFAAMVHARETPAAELYDHGPLLDGLVYPCLLRLQSSTRGDCAVQARHLVALWWLLRGETVRQWAAAAVRSATLRVLDVTVTLREEDAVDSEKQPQPHMEYWQLWLKSASRAAARASDAANEFLGLTLGWTGTPPSASTATSLRWRLPASSSPARIAFLALPWIRLWVLLCPPLFRISPADVLALRQYVQHDAELAVAAAAAAEQSGSAGHGNAPSAKNAKGTATVGAERASKAQATSVRDASPTNGRAAKPGARAVPARPANPRSSKKPPPPPPSSAVAASASSSPSRDRNGGRARDADAAALTPVTGEDAVALMQHRLRASTEPVCFWLRWSLLFLPPHRAGAEVTAAAAVPPAAAGEDDAASPLMAALETLCTSLRRPATVWLGGPPRHQPSVAAAAPPPTTELVRALTRAFPLYTPTETVGALQAQAHLFLTTRGPETLGADVAVTRVDQRFAAFSFAALLAPLRSAVDRAPQRRVSVPGSTAAVPAQDTPPPTRAESAQDDAKTPTATGAR